MTIQTRLRAAAALALAGLVSLATPVGAQQSAMTRVDLELMLAVDISQSMDYEEHSIQRQGYIDAFRHADVINALMSGPWQLSCSTGYQSLRRPVRVVPDSGSESLLPTGC